MEKNSPPEEFTLFCQECQKEFESYTDTRKHKREIHGIIEPVWNGNACIYCGQKHRPKIMLRLHITSNHPNRAFPCDHCDEVRFFESDDNIISQRIIQWALSCPASATEN